MKIIFRVDASVDIGSGHVMRCLTLADALKKQEAACHFICREHEGHLIELIKSKGHTVITLVHDQDVKGKASSYNVGVDLSSEIDRLAHADWLGTTQEQDAQQTITAITEAGLSCSPVDWLIIDHYALDYVWETTLSSYTKKILVIDDLADRKHHCHILLDQNLGKTPLNYQHLVSESCALLLGPQYALLQPQYAELHPRTPPRQGPIKNILIYFGGSDQHDLTGMATHACLQLNRPDIQLNVVMGNNYPHPEKLQQLAHTHSNIRLHQNLPSLAPLMLQADLAIGAGGSTSWERCCLGLPAIIVTLAENQVPIAQELHQQKLAHWLGNAEDINILKIQQAFSEILKDEQGLGTWSQRCFRVTQAQGTTTLANYLLLNKNTPLKVRLANLVDEKLLLDWANDPQTRQNSFNTAPITPEQHRQWFYQKLRQSEECKIYILETEQKLPIGQVRFDWQEEKQAWQINYSVASIARGNGLASKVLETALEQLRKDSEGILIIGEVKLTNIASQKAFKLLHFNEKRVGGGVLLFARMLTVG